MDLLTVDIGNTDIKFGIFRNGELVEQWRATGTHTHPERFSALLRDSLARTGVDFGALVYTSVVPAVEQVFRKTIQYCFNLPARGVFCVDPQKIRLPLDFQRYPLDQLGTDRLVNACSARLIYPHNHLLIVDFGTATTLDLVSRDGEYLGGAITPGLQTFTDCLPLKAPRLPQISLQGKTAANLPMGLNTVACLEAGLGLGYRGLLKELLDSALEAFEPPLPEFPEFQDMPRDFGEGGSQAVKVIATGGLAETALRLCGLSERFDIVDPMLTLKGLYLLYEFNQLPPAAAGLTHPA